VQEGDRVRKGQLLLQLDAQENQSTAAAAAAGVDEAQRSLNESLSRKQLADTTFERYQKMFNEQAVSRQEFDVKQTERTLAAQGVARAEARLRQAREGSRAAATMADYTRISAPISGIITSRQADLGATVFPSQPLMTIEDEGSYQLELAIPENLASSVKPGSPVQVTLDSAGSSFAAKISDIVPSADPASRTFTAKIALNQKGLRSGIFGRGTVSLGSSVKGLLVARKAIVERGALTAVWTLGADNIARMRLVKVGKTLGDRVEILAGLSDGERVVVSGAERVTEGSKVE
jgi:RND family efflux transporter MFP subunit